MQTFKDKIDPDHLPQHVAIIMDGNGRWAKSRGQKRTFGHKHAIKEVREAVNACNEIHIPYLTLYTFSSENWNRPEDEVDTLMSLISETLILEAEEIFTKGLRMHIIGDIEKLPQLVREQMQHLVDITKDNKQGNLILALSYGSHSEMLNAVKKISTKVKNGELSEEEITEKVFEDHLYTKDFPPVFFLNSTVPSIREKRV